MTTSSSPDELLRVEGAVEQPCVLSLQDLRSIDRTFQISDVSQRISGRQGSAVQLEGLLQFVRAKPEARYLGLHSSRDDFHASLPLAAIRERALLIYALDDQQLPTSAGGPVRFFILDHAACHSHEIDECANVKFVDRIELTAEQGYDNRPKSDADHARLHGHDAG